MLKCAVETACDPLGEFGIELEMPVSRHPSSSFRLAVFLLLWRALRSEATEHGTVKDERGVCWLPRRSTGALHPTPYSLLGPNVLLLGGPIDAFRLKLNF